MASFPASASPLVRSKRGNGKTRPVGSFYEAASARKLVRCFVGPVEWTPIYAALNLPLINEFSMDDGWESAGDRIAEYLAKAGLPERTIPIATERAVAREEAVAREQEKHENEKRAALERWREEQAAILQRPHAQEPKWGTTEAKRMEIERIRRKIEEGNKR